MRYPFERLAKSFKRGELQRRWGRKVTIGKTRSKTEVRGKRVRGVTRVVRGGQGACVALTGGRCGLGEDVTPPRKLARVTAPGHQPEGRAAKLENREEKFPTLAQPARIDWIREKAPNADRVSFWLRTEASGNEGAVWFLLDVIFTPVGNKFRG